MIKPANTDRRAPPHLPATRWVQQTIGRTRFVTLRAKLLLLLTLTVLGLLVALYIPLRVLVLGSYLTLEQQTMHTEMDRAQNALTGAIVKLDNSAAGYATWDDTFAFVADHNTRYMASNLADPSFPAENINLVIIADQSGHVVGQKAFDLNQQQATAVPVYFSQAQNLQNLLHALTGPNKPTNGLLLLPDRPMLIAARPILPSNGQGASNGTLLMGRFLDTILIQELADVTHLTLAVTAVQSSQTPAVARSLSLVQPEITSPLNAQSIAGYRLLNDVFGQPALVLEVTTPRSVYQQGVLTLNYVSLALIIILLVCFIVAVAVLERLVIARVTRLDAQVQTIGSSGDLALRMNVQGNDELARLAQSINSMLAEIDHAQLTRRQADELRAQTQEELLRAREQFSQMLVHDLKNPLTAATGYLDILKLGSLTEDQLILSDGAYRSIKNALILVSQILDVARLSEGRLEIRCEVADVRRMFETCIEELQTLAKLEDATVQVAPYVSAPNLFVDVSLMQRVLHNLVSNAIKHTPSGVTVTLGANLLEDGIELFVHDNGPGIDSSILPTIFERFQSGIATNADHNNTGLGLTFCKLATEAHHGTIAVESGQGNGTTFTIILPTSCIAAPDTLLLSSTPREISSVEALP